MFSNLDFDRDRITEAWKDVVMQKYVVVDPSTLLEEKLQIFKQTAKRVLELYDENKISKMESAYIIVGNIFDDELMQEGTETRKLISRAGELEIPFGATAIEDDTNISEEKYEHYWEEWRSNLENYIEL